MEPGYSRTIAQHQTPGRHKKDGRHSEVSDVSEPNKCVGFDVDTETDRDGTARNAIQVDLGVAFDQYVSLQFDQQTRSETYLETLTRLEALSNLDVRSPRHRRTFAVLVLGH